MTSSLESVAAALTSGEVPKEWSKAAYPSLKGLAGWTEDLKNRLLFVDDWRRQITDGAESKDLPIFWLGGLFFPQGFLTAVLQRHAREHSLPIDALGFDYSVRQEIDAAEYYARAESAENRIENGVLISGLFIEGARFGFDDGMGSLKQARPGELFSSMPLIHFRSQEKKTLAKSSARYECPVYKTAKRAGQLSTTGISTNFIIAVELPTGSVSKEQWALNGTACLGELPT
jgi:dynein heavy chain